MTTATLKNGNTLTIREASGADASACLSYLKIVGGETNYLLIGPEGLTDMTEEEEASFLESSSRNPDTAFYLGFVGDTLVSIASIDIPKNPRLRHNARFGLSVRRDYWNLGIGTAALNEIIRFCARHEPKVRNLTLEVYADNTRAISLYKKFGFGQEGCRKKRLFVNNTYHDELLMCLAL